MTESYSAFVASRPIATTPFQQGDTLALLRGGSTYQLPALLVPAYSGNVAITSSLSTGAAGNGITDDTAILQSLANSLSNTGGGWIIVPAAAFHYLAGILTVPPNVQIWGAAYPFTGWGESGAPPSWNPLTTGCGFYLHPTSGGISLNAGTSLRSLKILRSPNAASHPLLQSPNAAQVVSDVTQWGIETQTNNGAVALTLSNADFITLEDLFIVGFNTGIYSTRGDWYSNRVLVDCYNGVFFGNAGDINVHRNLRCEPWYGLSNGPGVSGGTWRRPGIGFHGNGGGVGSGVTLRDCFSFGWDTGFKLENSTYDLDGCVVDSAASQDVYSQVGVQCLATCGQVFIRNQFINNQNFGIDIQGGGPYLIDNPQLFFPNPYVSGGTALIQVRKLSGGNVFGLIQGGHFGGSSSTPPLMIFGANIGGSWKISAPYLDGFPNPWITIDASDLGSIEVESPNFYNGATIPAYAARNQGAFVTGAQLAGTLAAPSNPATTTSASLVMMGLAVTLTPTATGRVKISIQMQIANGTTNDGFQLQLKYGTGAAPTNGVAATGTSIGQSLSAQSAVGGDLQIVTVVGSVGLSDAARLTCGTAYWFDLAYAATGGGTVTVQNVTAEVLELQN